MLRVAPEHVAAVPQLSDVSGVFEGAGKVLSLQDTQNRHIDVSRKDLPQEVGPFEQHVADVKGIQDPSPLVAIQVKGLVCAGGFGIANVSSV